MADAVANKTFLFELVSPERVMASEQAVMVTIPGEEGEFGVLAGHAPLLSSVRPGVVVITGEGQVQKKVFVSGGFADVNEKTCSVLAEDAVDVSELDRSAIENTLKALNDDLAAAKGDDIKTQQIQGLIDIADAKLQAIAA
jgi:F-type H+-transporting ATPase subunit epsilon